MSVISVKGASCHNLKNISLEIPKNSLVVVTGVSGSGKSSLVFDTIFAEAFRRFAEASNLPLHLLDSYQISRARGKFVAINGLPPAFGLSQKQRQLSNFSTVGTVTGLVDLFRVLYAAYGEIHCRTCEIPLKATTFIEILENIKKVFSDKLITIIAPIAEKRKGAHAGELEKFRKQGFSRLRLNGELYDLQAEAEALKIDPQKLNTIELLVDKISVKPDKYTRLERTLQSALDNGKGLVKIECENKVYFFNVFSKCPQCGEFAPKLDPRHFSHSSLGQCEECGGLGTLAEEEVDADIFPCEVCHGTRLSPKIPKVLLYGETLAELIQTPFVSLEKFVRQILLPEAMSNKAMLMVVFELHKVLLKAIELGQGHQTLLRAANSLAPGDLQRLRLASILAAPLTGSLYILDEPCQGLTSDEVFSLASVVRELVAKGCSCLIVEHHPQFLKESDVLITLGPGAGKYGGKIVSVEKKDPELRTGGRETLSSACISSGDLSLFSDSLVFNDICIRNIKLDNLFVVQGGITILRGHSGSGKSSFLNYCVKPALAAIERKENNLNSSWCKVTVRGNIVVKSIIETKPGALRRSSRRTIAAAVDILPLIRELFAKLPESNILGLTPMHFSWNSPLGRCPSCDGKGFTELKQKYGSPLKILCEECQGLRLNANALKPRFKGLTITEVLALSIDEANDFLSNFKLISQRLQEVCRFGLGYLALNQGLDSLSGGELQRLLLAIELKKSDLLGRWFLLMHPGTGLHLPDVEFLSSLIRDMTAKGASFILIENREEFLPLATIVHELPR